MMQRSVTIARAQWFSSRIAMVLLALSLLSLADGLLAQMQRGVNRIDGIPGGVYSVSGPMPPNTERVEEFVVDGGSRDGQVVLQPQADPLSVIEQAVRQDVPQGEQANVQALVVEELRRIHEGVLARYGLRPSDYTLWRARHGR